MSDNLGTLDWMRDCIAEGERLDARTEYLAALTWAIAELRWRPIETAPCDDTFALVAWERTDKNPLISQWISIEDLNHDSDPQWWKERGATHWMPLPGPPEAP